MMPWCGYWTAPLGGFWWLMPLFGLLFVTLMIVLCFRGFGRWSWRFSHPGWAWRPRHSNRDAEEVSALRREVATLRDEIQKLRQPT